MLTKDEVLVWFKDLQSSSRVDIMCRLLRCCASLELRHLCSVVEGLVQDSYQFLKNAEFQANHLIKREGLDQRDHPCSDFVIGDPSHRANCLATLALLHSDNKSVACNVLFPVLSVINPEIVQSAGDFQMAEEILLMLYMAANHNAFTVSQRSALWEKINQLQTLGISSEAKPMSPDLERESICTRVSPDLLLATLSVLRFFPILFCVDKLHLLQVAQ